jgi:predicted nucleic acid-binding protein
LSYVCLDTGPIVEYVDLAGVFHSQAEAVIRSILAGKLIAIVPHPVLAETYYVSLRIYERLGLDKAQARAEKLVDWLCQSPNFTIAESSAILAKTAGQVKRDFGLALTDAYVIAASEIEGGKAVFRTRETEMKKDINLLSRKYEVLFLEDYV